MRSLFPISSDDAYVAISSARCWKCDGNVRVVCLYCARGEINGEVMEHFVISNLVEADASLLEALRSFPQYRVARSHQADMSYFANHCDGCGSLQGDFYLHSQPGGAFFPETIEDFARISFTPIDSPIRCDGGEEYGTMADAFEAWTRRRPE